jgi:hypothetical protein
MLERGLATSSLTSMLVSFSTNEVVHRHKSTTWRNHERAMKRINKR